MDLFLDPDAEQALTQQLYEQLRRGIATGRLRPGDQLTPSRQLAGELRVSRHTVTTAYGRLVAEGYAEGHAGGGSVVAAASPAPSRETDHAAALRPVPRFAGWSPLFRPLSHASPFDLRPGLADPALFPVAMWRRRVAAAIVTGNHLDYGDPAGRLVLRRAIARWIGRSRSVLATEDTIVVTCGAQHAIDLMARVLLQPGDTVAVENPGYLPAVRLFGALGAQVAGVPVDEHGLVVDQLPPTARLVYVTPSHQYPLGMTMSMTRRRALLQWAQRHDAAIIEDDYDTEFRYVDRPLEPLHTLDSNGRVAYVGSFSKSFSPSVRLGFAVLPQSLVEPIVALRQAIDWAPPTATQTALAGFIGDGLLDKHIRRARRAYTERHRLLTEALHGPLAPRLTALASNAGLHIAAILRGELSDNEALEAAAKEGIVVSGLSECFHTGPAQPGLLIGFGAISTARLPAALKTLEHVLAR
jgi:GntR family transcriptional regulator/MocR family aminotransferase